MRPVILIPTGRLALLPLHAARLPDGTYFLDHFTVTYVPSATALAEARRRAAAAAGPLRLFGVGNPLPSVDGLRDLHRQLREAAATLPSDPSTASLRAELQKLLACPTEELRHEGFLLRRLILRLPERLGEPLKRLVELGERWPLSLRYARAELQSVVDLLPQGAAVPLYEEEAAHDAVLSGLAGATLLHFSCHGSFRPDEPLESALHLADKDLTLRETMAPEFAALDAARLAVLSACQTAIADFRNLPEEAIGLPAGFLQAGVPVVLGTLWPVDDPSAALLMTRFYEYLFQEREPPARALRRAQRWLRDLTNAELEGYLARHQEIAEARRQAARRMPLVMIEELLLQAITTEDPDARPYARPYYWAPFVLLGAGEVVL
ncbi:MAG: CHAT domain-containing protein [Chloroflexia bacterium]